MTVDFLGIGISSIISLIFGILISRYFAQRRSLFWTAIRRKILDPVDERSPDGVKILFDGAEVNGLAEWKIAIWNGGNTAISKADFIVPDPILGIFSSEKLLKVSDAVVSRDIIDPLINIKSESELAISLDLLDQKDWLIFTAYTQLHQPGSFRLKDALNISSNILNIPKGIKRIRKPLYGSSYEAIIFVITPFIYGGFSVYGANSVFKGVTNLTKEDSYLYILPIFGETAAAASTYIIAAFLATLSLSSGILAIFSFFVFCWATYSRPPKEIRERMFDKSSASFFPRFVRRKIEFE